MAQREGREAAAPPPDATEADGGSIQGTWTQLGHWPDLLQPSPAVQEAADRRRARMAAGISLTLGVAAIASTILLIIGAGSRLGTDPGPSAMGGILAGLAAVPLLSGAYALSRSRWWRLGAWLTVASCLALALVAAAVSAWAAQDHRPTFYVGVTLLVAAALLRPIGTLVTAGLGIGGVASFVVWVPGTTYTDVHPAIIFLVMLAVVSLLFTSIRARDLEALRRQAEELQRAQGIASLGSWSLDPRTEEVRWTKQMYRIYGIEPGTPVGLDDAMEGVHEQDAERIWAEYDRVLNSGGEVTEWGPIEYRFTDRQGEEHSLYAEARATFDHQGELIDLAGTVQDVTEQRALESRFEQLLEAAPDALILVDTEGDIVLVNQQTETLFGWDREELIGQPIETLVPEAIRHDHVGYREAYMADPESRPMGLNLDLHGVRKDGTDIPVEIGLAPLQTEDGLRVMAAVRDMTERARIQEELRAYARRLERSNRDWEHFAYVVSHDLQEPIRMVNSYLQLLVRRYEGQLDSEADQYIGYAQEGAKRMRTLIQGLLEYSRVDTGGTPQAPIDTEEVLEGVLNSLQVSIRDRQATVTYGDLPTVLADEGQLGQVLQNLLSNAIKFVPEDRDPEIHISAEKEDDQWHFRVEDNGIGIDPEHADRIFVIFRRLNARGTYEGEGIGLAVCKKIIERHRGKLWVTPNEEVGSTFHFTLPAPEAQALEPHMLTGEVAPEPELGDSVNGQAEEPQSHEGA